MKQFILSATFILFYSLCIAQNGEINGTITQAETGNSLPGISVFLKDTNHGSATNGKGYFTLSEIPEGNYTLVASCIGFDTERIPVTVTSGEETRVSLVMVESVSSLSAVTIMTGGSSGLRDIPGSVHYISPREIEKFSYTDINRTLRAVPGINIQEEDGFGLRPNIGLRGTGVERSSKITVMEDGVLMAPAPYAAPAAYYFPTIGRMQGVEILKGSSQIKYGPYTTGGAINLISTQIPTEFAGRLNLLAGSFGSRNLHAFAGNSQEHFGYMIESFQYGSEGFKQLDGGGNTGFDKQDYLAKIQLKTGPNTKVFQSITFKIGQSLETSHETYLGLIEEDFNEDPYRRYAASQVDKMDTEQSQFSLTHIAEFSDFFDITTTAYRTNFKRNWYKLNKITDSTVTKIGIASILENPQDFKNAFDIIRGEFNSAADAIEVKANNRSYYSQGVQTILGFDFQTSAINHQVDLGLRIHQDQIDRFQWVDLYAMEEGVMELTSAGTPGTESNRVETANALAAYVQYKLEIGAFTASPGVRYENISIARKDFGKNDTQRLGEELTERSNQVEVFIPGIGLNYQFNGHVSIFGGVHKGFAPPGSKEDTTPEESINYELGSRFQKGVLSGEAVLFFNDYSNLLGTDLNAAGGGGTGDLFNGGEAQSQGLEFLLNYDVLSSNSSSSFRIPLTVVYTYTDATFQNDFDSEFEGWGTVEAGDQLPYLASHQFSVVLGIENSDFAVNASGRYMDGMRTSPGQGEIPDNEGTDSYFVLDLSVNYNLHKNVALFANATNLTNEVYIVARRPAGIRPGMPRAFNAGVKVNF